MSRLYTRRAFLLLAGAAATTVGLMGLFHISTTNRTPEEGRCPKCKAFYTKANKYKGKYTSGEYCPNCGIELTKRAYDLTANDRLKFVLKHRQRNKRTVIWEWAQVPFPNARLILQSDKPAVVFSEMKI